MVFVSSVTSHLIPLFKEKIPSQMKQTSSVFRVVTISLFIQFSKTSSSVFIFLSFHNFIVPCAVGWIRMSMIFPCVYFWLQVQTQCLASNSSTHGKAPFSKSIPIAFSRSLLLFGFVNSFRLLPNAIVFGSVSNFARTPVPTSHLLVSFG